MPERRLKKTRDAYKKSVNYLPCDRYVDHVIDKITQKCTLCGKSKIEIDLAMVSKNQKQT